MSFDPYLGATSLLLHGDGADNGTVFTDSVGGNTVTVVGNAVTKTATKKYGTASMYFDGVGDYASVPNTAEFRFGTGDFTVECWLMPTSYPSGGSNNDLTVYGDLSGNGYFFLDNTLGRPNLWDGVTGVQAPTGLPINEWSYVAWVRLAGVVTIYVNGVSVATGAMTTNFNSTTETLKVGGNAGGFNNRYFTGYIDDLRITKGVARYTANFTPPEAAHPNVGTALLLNMNGADNSTTFTDQCGGKTVTVTGNAVTKTAQKVFGTASAYFDGTGDYLSATHKALDLSTGDFTVEGWIRVDDLTVNRPIAFMGSLASNANRLMFTAYVSGEVSVYSEDGVAVGATAPSENGLIVAGVWAHVAFVRYGAFLLTFVDGVLRCKAPYTITIASGSVLYIGTSRIGGVQTYFKGYIDSLRVVKGVALYTTDFAVNSDPYWSNVVLASHVNGSTNLFAELTGKVGTFVGNAICSTTQKKFGSGSLYFDGTGDYVEFPDSEDWNFGVGDFTIECWYKLAAAPAVGAYPGVVAQRGDGVTDYGFCVYMTGDSGGQIGFGYTADGTTATYVLGGVTFETTLFHHLAVVRLSNTITIFHDGTPVGSGSVAGSLFNSASKLFLGRLSNNAVAPNVFNGYIDDIRITKGVARYS